MFNDIKLCIFEKKLNLLINEPIFKQKLFDLIPKNNSNIKVHITSNTLHINKVDCNNSIDDLIIKINKNTVWYYYYSTGNFNEYGKMSKSNVDVSTKYCHYDINNTGNTQDIVTKTSTFIFDNNLNEIYKQFDTDIQNFLIVNGKKCIYPCNSTSKNVCTCERKLKLKDGRVLGSIQIKYKEENMKVNNREKYYISDCNRIYNNSKVKRLSRKSYLEYVKKNSIV